MDHFGQWLLKTECPIAQAEMAVMRQIAEIDRLRFVRQDTAVAERTLLAFVRSLEAMRELRETRLRARMEARRVRIVIMKMQTERRRTNADYNDFIPHGPPEVVEPHSL